MTTVAKRQYCCYFHQWSHKMAKNSLFSLCVVLFFLYCFDPFFLAWLVSLSSYLCLWCFSNGTFEKKKHTFQIEDDQGSTALSRLLSTVLCCNIQICVHCTLFWCGNVFRLGKLTVLNVKISKLNCTESFEARRIPIGFSVYVLNELINVEIPIYSFLFWSILYLLLNGHKTKCQINGI